MFPQQDDEFTCSECFIVSHHSRLTTRQHGTLAVEWTRVSMLRTLADVGMFGSLVADGGDCFNATKENCTLRSCFRA